jgi:cytoskeletal protein RodZ
MSFGEELRRERELRQISLREIAHATKIDLRRLEALEQNDFSRLPGGLYNRGFVRAYCDHIGVDAESMVNAYLLEERSQTARPESTTADVGLLRGSTAAKTLTAELADVIDRSARRTKRGRSRRLWLLLLLVTVVSSGALGLWWWLGAGR